MKNPLELVAFVLSDPSNKSRATIIVECTRPAHAWYASQAHLVRSSPSARAWYAAQAKGVFWDHVAATFGTVLVPRVLEAIGMRVVLSDSDRALALADPAVQEEAELGNSAGAFCSTLVCRRVTRCGWMMYGYPGQFVQLEDDETSAEALAQLRRDYNMFVAAGNVHMKFYDKLVRSSPFQKMSVKQVVLALVNENWELTDGIKSLLSKRSHTLRQSRVVEDSFLRAKRLNARSASGDQRPETIWFELLSKQVLNKVYSYIPVHFDDDTGDERHITDDLFRAKISQSWPELKRIKSTDRTPPWPTYSPTSEMRIWADLFFLRSLDPDEPGLGVV